MRALQEVILMAEHVTGFQTPEGVKKYDYHSLANKPESFSNALKGSARGKVVRVDDVSPVEHKIVCKARGKNLIPYPYVETTLTRGGLTFTDVGDGTIRVRGTVTDNFAIFTLSNNIELVDGVTYFVGKSPHVYLAYNAGPQATSYAYNKPLTWSKNYAFVKLYLQYAKGEVVDEVIQPMLSVGNTATEYVPYVNPSIATVAICGKNLIPLKAAVNGTTKGIAYTNKGNGIITINGTATEAAYVPVETELYLPKGKYTLSQQGDNISPSYLYITGATGYTAVPNNGSKVVTSTGGICQIYIYVEPGATVENKTVKAMLEAGEIPSRFESPIESQTVAASSSGAVDGIYSLPPTMTFISDNEDIELEVEYQRDINILTKTVPLIDRVTGIPYYLYVSDGKLQIEEREV
jgi:hypothetical protein